MSINNAFKLALSIIVSELAGIAGSFFTASAIPTWYAGIAKPAFAPPNWIFAPVWTTLFALMGVASFLIWKRGFEKKNVKIALGIFLGQLILNVFWSIIFFGLRNPGAAFAELLILWIAILATIISFYKISRPAAWLLLPYIVWVSFAGCLNYSIWQPTANSAEKVFCTQEAKECPDGSFVGRTGPNCEFAACPSKTACREGACLSKNNYLPEGYTLEAYRVEKISEDFCEVSLDCQTPAEYLSQSRCPFVSMCLNSKCAVVCPAKQDITWSQAEEMINNCSVKKVFQAHSRQVVIYSKNGQSIQTIEPELDLVMDIALAAESKCGKIEIGTE